ncbi:YpsA SLOG family protein [Nocardioides sp. P5_C9_2]
MVGPETASALVVVSGGQSGVDRAALDVAIALGLPYAGWCPAGGVAEDEPAPPGLLAAYPGLRESPTPDPAERTRLNVRDSTAVLVVAPAHLVAGGTLLTVDEATRLGRPCLVTTGPAERVAAWLDALPAPCVLDVAGPRSSEWPQGYDVARRLLEELWDRR